MTRSNKSLVLHACSLLSVLQQWGTDVGVLKRYARLAPEYRAKFANKIELLNFGFTHYPLYQTTETKKQLTINC